MQTQLAAAVALSRELGRVDPEAAAEHQAAVEAMFAEVDFVAGRMAAEARRPGSSAVAPRGAGARQMRRVRAIEVRAGAEEVEANLSKLLGGLEAAEHGKGGAEELQEEVQAARAQAQALQVRHCQSKALACLLYPLCLLYFMLQDMPSPFQHAPLFVLIAVVGINAVA